MRKQIFRDDLSMGSYPEISSSAGVKVGITFVNSPFPSLHH